jgi:hypothetical protein
VSIVSGGMFSFEDESFELECEQGLSNIRLKGVRVSYIGSRVKE